ncbi:hypothetical protein [uncultured Jatrophihabitans sp.]|uniref:hypothetical protein n=1 Tax=uncultured Jatrophihabitans sp. TaxID=1610747 RepID=UPI0035C9C201
MSHHGTHPHASEWADARDTVGKLIQQVEQTLQTIESARRHLNWRGGSERYYQWQAGQQHHYLSEQLDYLRELHDWLDRAARHPGEAIPQPLTVGAR